MYYFYQRQVFTKFILQHIAASAIDLRETSYNTIYNNKTDYHSFDHNKKAT